MSLINVLLLVLMLICVIYQFEAGLQGLIAFFLMLLVFEAGRIRRGLVDIYAKLSEGVELNEVEQPKETTPWWFVDGNMEQKQ